MLQFSGLDFFSMTPQQYIQEELEKLKEFVSRKVANEKLTDEIYRLLLSKKFRKYAVTTEYQEFIKNAITQCIVEQKPIQLTLVFGGYKLWRLDTSPEVDFAELFTLMYYAQWLKPICEIYTPGVWMDFFSDDVIVPWMNNIPKEDTKKYAESFSNLLTFMKQYVPSNLSMTLHKVGDLYESYDAFKKEVEENMQKITAQMNGLPTLTSELLHAVELNVKTTPEQEKDPQWREKVQLVHEAYSKVSKRRPYYRRPDKIFVSMRPSKDSLAVGSTKTSVMKFWIGTGVLKKDGSTFREYIFSPHQLEETLHTKQPIFLDGLTGRNFFSIDIFS